MEIITEYFITMWIRKEILAIVTVYKNPEVLF